MREDVVADVARLIASVEATVSSERIHGVVDSVLTRNPPAVRMLAMLQAEPSLLTSSSSQIPKGLERIIAGIRDIGGATVQLPLCTRCRQQRPLSRITENGRICAQCASHGNRRNITCSRCGERRRFQAELGGKDHCSRCCRELAAGAADRLLSNLRVKYPQLEADVLHGIVDQQRKNVGADGRLLKLAIDFETFSDVWTSRPAAATWAFVKLYDALIVAGLPLAERQCGYCGLVSALTERHQGLICCRKCYRAENLSPCDGCGETASIERKQADGSRLCQRCTNKLEDESAHCVICGVKRMVAARTTAGPMCMVCRSSTRVDVCSRCHKSLPCTFTGTEKALCKKCRDADRVDECTVCSARRKCRFPGTGKAICNQCANLREPCIKCQKVRLLQRRTPEGGLICWECAEPNIERCIGCGKDRKVNGRVNGAAYCPYCYPRHPASFQSCRRCNEHRRVFRSGLCEQCTANDRVDSLISEEAARLTPSLATIRAVCLAADPKRVLSAFQRRPTEILKCVLEEPGSLSHDRLDELGSERATRTVRSFLVEHGLLPPRDEILHRFQQWIDDAATQIANPRERQDFIQFGRWRHLRYFREQPSPARLSQATSRRTELYRIIELLAWLESRELSLATMAQADLDRWLATGPMSRRRVEPFLRWTARAHRSNRFVVPSIPKTPLALRGQQSDSRWLILNRLLSDDSIDPRIRLAGSLVLLYGARITHLAQLRVEDIFTADGLIYVRLGSEPLALPDHLGDLALGARSERAAKRMFSPVNDEEWLFPGTKSRCPLSPTAISMRLRNLGIRPAQARTSALVSLVQILPPIIIARLIGLDVRAVERWASAVGASRSRYLALRASN